MTGLTGGTGFVGNVVARTLKHSNTSYRTLVRSSAKAREIGLPGEGLESGVEPTPSCSAIVGDLEDGESLRRCFDGCDTVIHTAALISTDSANEPELMRVNVDGTRAVIDACRSCGVTRLVYLGSIEAFDLEGGTAPGAGGYVDPSKPILAYGRSKAHAINLVLDANGPHISTTVISPTAILGPWDFAPSPMGRFIRAFLRRRLPAYVHGGFDFVDVRDVANAAIYVSTNGAVHGHIRFTGHRLSVEMLLGMLSELSGVAVPKLQVPDSIATLFARVNVTVCRILRRLAIITPEAVRLLGLDTQPFRSARTESGFAVRDIRQTITDTIEWFTRRTV